MMLMMITPTIRLSKEKIQVAVFRCLNCYFTEQSNLVLFGSGFKEVRGSQMSCAQYKKALWMVRTPLTGSELPVTGGVPRETGCYSQGGFQLRH